MPSLIPGYEYDIFISYRQKDNKYDGWVTEFVDNLKKELEATFKEEISVYFDINPHDGLLETHDVDASLKDKLKCLIFIPIISRTYCDPKSFAWEHEFKVFVEETSKDQFGIKVKLTNGNVASRVLPVRIHDLDAEDIKLCESVLGGVLRGVEFIYKEPGVNKPLTFDDDEKKNLNKTKYRIQINKVANAIKEIIQGIKVEPIPAVKEKTDQKKQLEENKIGERKEVQEKSAKVNKLKLLPGILITAISIIVIIFAYLKIFKQNTSGKLQSSGKRISVVVMPFQNMTGDTIWDVWQNGIQTNLFTVLSNNPEELKVRQIESINNILQNKGLARYFSITPSLASTISKKLNANVFIYGSINQSGSTIRLNAQLVDSKTIDALSSFQIDGTTDNILHLIDSLSLMIKNFLIMSELGKDLPTYSKNYVITSSPDAFRYFIYGRNYFYKLDYPTALNWLSQAISADSNFIQAITMLSIAYANQFQYELATKSHGNELLYDQAKKWCIKAYEKRDQMPIQQKINTNRIYAMFFETPNEEIKYLKQLLDFDDQNPIVYYNLGSSYDELNQYDEAIPEYKKALEIYKKWEIKPDWIFNYTNLGDVYHKTGKYKEEERLYKKAEQDFPDDPNLIYNQTLLSLTFRDTIAAKRYSGKGILFMKNISMSDASIAIIQASIFAKAGLMDKAEEYYQRALSFEPDNPDRLNDLAYFLIDKNRNINKGLEIVNKALRISPENYNYLHTKGWGLYKQDKYQEALEILQKSWDSRRQNAVYDHEAFLHLEAAKKAVTEQKNN